MRYRAGWCMAVMMLGTGSWLVAEEVVPVKTGSWLSWWKSDKKEPAADTKKAGPIVTPEVLRIRRGEIEADLKRRLAVCLELQNVAAQTQDDDLQRKAEQLEHRVWELHRRQQGALPIVSAAVSEKGAQGEKP